MDYTTVKRQAVGELTEKRSKFIASISPIGNESEALEFIGRVKTMHRDARHNVYAYTLNDNQIVRYSDDGEPSGTAGMPVLDILRGNNILDTVIVVTRYFGGILLGTGGLVRAYSRAAKLALDKAGIQKKELCSVFRLVCDYKDYNSLLPLLSSLGGCVDDVNFEQQVSLKLCLPKSRADIFKTRLGEMSGGALNPEYLTDAYMDKK